MWSVYCCPHVERCWEYGVYKLWGVDLCTMNVCSRVEWCVMWNTAETLSRTLIDGLKTWHFQLTLLIPQVSLETINIQYDVDSWHNPQVNEDLVHHKLFDYKSSCFMPFFNGLIDNCFRFFYDKFLCLVHSEQRHAHQFWGGEITFEVSVTLIPPTWKWSQISAVFFYYNDIWE